LGLFDYKYANEMHLKRAEMGATHSFDAVFLLKNARFPCRITGPYPPEIANGILFV
jgi:hypothetical protein